MCWTVSHGSWTRGGERNPVRFYLGTVRVLFCTPQIETLEKTEVKEEEREREKKSNEKNFLKEVE